MQVSPAIILLLVPEAVAQVAASAVGQHRYHHAFRQSLRHAKGSQYGGSARWACKDTLVAGQSAGRGLGLFCVRVETFVGNDGIAGTNTTVTFTWLYTN